jgi:hypothetical protein
MILSPTDARARVRIKHRMPPPRAAGLKAGAPVRIG